jgi:hypothetical protein
MLRAIGGLFAASLVAPYLATFPITLFFSILDHVSRSGALMAQPPLVDGLLRPFNLAILATFRRAGPSEHVRSRCGVPVGCLLLAPLEAGMQEP